MYDYNQNNPEYYEAYRLAQRRVKDRMGFYWHLATYVIVNGFLITIYLLTSLASGGLYYPWFIWPLAGWGIGLLLNFLGVFVLVETPASQQQKIAREMEQMGYTPPTYPLTPPPTTPEPYPNYNNQTKPENTADLVGHR